MTRRGFEVVRAVLAAVALAAVAACSKADREADHRPGRVIRSRVVFLSEDLQTGREPLPLGAFRLWFPYIAGDLYGSPTVADYLQPVIREDYTFEIDLDRGHDGLVASLQPTEFSLPHLKIDPPDARIARMTPQALEADGIEQVGVAQWVDASSMEPLMLVYIDRPAAITGSMTTSGGVVRYDVRADAPGYIWIGGREGPDGAWTYVARDAPESVILAVTPKEPLQPKEPRQP